MKKTKDKELSKVADSLFKFDAGLIMLDINMEVFKVNKIAEEMLVFNRQDILGKGFFDVLNPVSWGSKEQKDFKEKLKTKGSWKGELSYKGKRNELILLDCQCSQINLGKEYIGTFIILNKKEDRPSLEKEEPKPKTEEHPEKLTLPAQITSLERSAKIIEEFALIISSTKESEKVIRLFLEKISQMCRCDRVLLVAVDLAKEGGPLFYQEAKGDYITTENIPLSIFNLADTLPEEGKCFLLKSSEVPQEIAKLYEKFKIETNLFCLLYIKNDNPWILSVQQDKGKKEWTQEDREVFQQIIPIIKIALESSLTLKKIKEKESEFVILADTDLETVEKQERTYEKKINEVWKSFLSGIFNFFSNYERKITEINEELEGECIKLGDYLSTLKDELPPEIREGQNLRKIERFSDNILDIIEESKKFLTEKAGDQMNLASYLKTCTFMMNELKKYIARERHELENIIRELEVPYIESSILRKIEEDKVCIKSILTTISQIDGILEVEILSENGQVLYSMLKENKTSLSSKKLQELVTNNFHKIKRLVQEPVISWIIELEDRLVSILPLVDDRALCFIGDDDSSLFSLKITLENSKKMKKVLDDLLPTKTVLEEDISRLSEIDKMKSNLLYRLLKEITTHLSVIEGYSEILNQKPTPASIRENSMKVKETLESLSKIISSNMLLNDLELGKFQIKKEEVNLQGVTQTIIDKFRNFNKHEVKLEIEESARHLKADPHGLKIILSNLLENAVNYSPDGGLVMVKAYEKDDKIVIAVIDHGKGIPIRHIPYLFTPYYHLDKKSSEFKGIGLGLPIAKGIMALHGGDLWVESEEGKGSIFYVTLPIE